MKQRVDIRVESELAEWAVVYAAERGVTKTAVYEAALQSFREDAESGRPGAAAREPVRVSSPRQPVRTKG
jgi:hypothetical protein